MRRKSFMQLVLAASVAAFVPLGTAQAEPLQSAELAALVGNKGFDFRGRQTMWKFTPDGKVQADDNSSRATQGAMGESWGMKNSGTWRVQGDKLCIQWRDSQSDQCYTVSRSSTGRMVTLSGPRTIEGTLDARDDTGVAETPRRTAPELGEQPGLRYNYQRIPGAR
jgi:hypothetical protein